MNTNLYKLMHEQQPVQVTLDCETAPRCTDIESDGTLTADMIKRLIGRCLLDVKVPQKVKVMDYSGAHLYIVPLIWDPANASDLQLRICEAIVKVVGVSLSNTSDKVKGLRNARSYENEVKVLQNLCTPLREFGIGVPHVLATSTAGSVPIDSVNAEEREPDNVKFRSIVILERLATPMYVQSAVFGMNVSKACLCWLARFHAFGLSINTGERKGLGIWDVGGHIPLSNSPSFDISKLAFHFEAFCKRFAEAPLSFRQPDKGIGPRLQAIATKVSGWLLAPENDMTLVHGDFKAGNIFVNNTNLSNNSAIGISAIDWQWTGWGVGMQDVIYFLSTSADDASCEDLDGSLRYYHKALLMYIKEINKYKGLNVREPPFTKILMQFQLGTLDYARWAWGYRLLKESPESLSKRSMEAVLDINQGEYRRSFKRLSWLLQLVEEYLPLAERGLLVMPGCDNSLDNS